MSLFNTVTIQTPESVELEFTLAGIGNRALALLVDYVVLALLMSLVSFLATFLREQVVNLATVIGGTSQIELWLAAIAAVLLAAIYLGYFAGFESVWQGQTPGKRWAKIRVISDDGKPEGVFQATLRSLLRPVDDILFIGFFFIIFSAQEKRIGDWLAGTLVVQNERPAASALAVSEAAKTVARQLDRAASVDNLMPSDFATLREYLQRRPLLLPAAKSELDLKLAREIKQIIELETLPQEMTAETFLEAVYWAYQERAPFDHAQG
ncbi:MAG: RDD family protein [Leptolyngbya sp. SIO4C1]|nr:RDD family protein [Leptolyngbya sp. SIO4C1]